MFIIIVASICLIGAVVLTELMRRLATIELKAWVDGGCSLATIAYAQVWSGLMMATTYAVITFALSLAMPGPGLSALPGYAWAALAVSALYSMVRMTWKNGVGEYV